MKDTHMLAWLRLLALLTITFVSFTAYAGDINSDLWLAAQKSETAKVKALLEQGADVNSKDKNGWTALMYAATYGRRPAEILQALLDNGADVNARDSNGDTALLIAGERRNTGVMEIVQILLDKGADVNAKNKNGRTALMAAASESKVEILQALLAKGIDVNAKDSNGDTALIRAVRAVTSLPDDFPPSGVTGADERVATIVQALLNNGADVNAKNKKGETALMWAKIWADHFGGFKVVQLLEKAGAKE